MNLSYRWSLDESAYDVLVALPRRRRTAVERALRGLAANPFAEPSFSTLDDHGLRLDVVFAADCMITYHLDHAVRTVHIADISDTL